MSESLHLQTRYREPAGPATLLLLILWLFFTFVSYLLGAMDVLLPETLMQNVTVSYASCFALIFGLTTWIFAFVRYDRTRRLILLLPTLASVVYPVVLLAGFISQHLSQVPFIH